MSIILLIGDMLAIGLSFLVSYRIRLWLNPILGDDVVVQPMYQAFGMAVLLIMGLFIITGLYPGARRIGVVEFQEIIINVSISFVILGLAIFVLRFGNMFSRTMFGFTWFFSCTFITVFRLIIHNRGSLFSWWSQPVLVVGNKEDVDKIIFSLIRARRMAIRPVVALILDQNFKQVKIDGIPYYPYSTILQKQIRNNGVQLAIYVNDSFDIKPNHSQQLHMLSLTFSKLIYVMGESPLSSLSMKPIELEGRPALQVQYNLLDPWSVKIKRFTELLFCFISLIIIFPLFLIIALLVRIDSPGPIIFTQKRLGKNGQIFNLYKFRTMENDAEEKFQALLMKNRELRIEYQKFHKIRNDPRITRVGRFLRKTSLDEFPQIWNVIRGEMSLIGPRAYLPAEIDQMGDSAALIHRVPPGLTGWWQVMGRHDTSFNERLKLDEYYISNFSLWMDFYILIKTVWIVISCQGE